MEFAGLDKLRELSYPFNVHRTPAATYNTRVDKVYMKRMYMLYGINNEPNNFPDGKKINLERLFLDFITDNQPVGSPFVMKMSDLIKYLE